MILTKTSSTFSAVAMAWLLVTAGPAATATPAAPGLTGIHRGGQAPGSAAGGTSTFVVVIARGLEPSAADKLKQDLISDGFATAETREDTGGRYQVVVGGLPSNDQASNLMRELRDSGFTPDSIREDNAAAADSSSDDTVYRVQVAEFPSRDEAVSARDTLAEEGFVNVDVVEENDRFLVLLGTFNRRAEAQTLLTDVNRAGFALAQVIDRQRLRSTSTTPTAGAGLEAATLDVLSLAEKVESGDASADEFRQLREKKQQLPEAQKQIVEQTEQTRAADRQNQQQVFEALRRFDRAMIAQSYDQAGQALAQVRQLDPSNLSLASRERALAAAQSGTAPTSQGGYDPAAVQQAVNDARKLEREGHRERALAKYREALAADPSNVEARTKVSELSAPPPTAPAADAAPDTGGDSTASQLMDNKALVYGGGAALLLIILFLVFRRKKAAPATPAPASTLGTGFIDPLDGPAPAATPATQSFDTPVLGGGGDDVATALTGAEGAGMAPPSFATFEAEEPEEPVTPAPAPAPAPAEPVQEESDTVSFANFDFGTQDEPTPAPAAPPAPEPAPVAEDEPFTLNLEEIAGETPVPQEAPAAPTSALDADLESLLRGTFPGAPADAEESPLESATPGLGVEELAPAGAPAGSTSRVVFEQTFEHQAEGSVPEGWSGEYDYASLTVERLDEAGHTQCLCFHKPEGTGSATYHLKFPQAQGLVTAEFDIRCDQKNKFLLGVYFEKDEDFKQSVHTIVHQLDPNAPAALRLQGNAAPYDMATWRRVRFEVNLHEGTVDAWLDNEQVAAGVALPSNPAYLNTISIRDNLATTGTLLLDNIRISEA